MKATYRLAINGPYQVMPFGPLLTLDKAEGYQRDMERAGKQVLIVNTVQTELN